MENVSGSFIHLEQASPVPARTKPPIAPKPVLGALAGAAGAIGTIVPGTGASGPADPPAASGPTEEDKFAAALIYDALGTGGHEGFEEHVGPVSPAHSKDVAQPPALPVESPKPVAEPIEVSKPPVYPILNNNVSEPIVEDQPAPAPLELPPPVASPIIHSEPHSHPVNDEPKPVPIEQSKPPASPLHEPTPVPRINESPKPSDPILVEPIPVPRVIEVPKSAAPPIAEPTPRPMPIEFEPHSRPMVAPTPVPQPISVKKPRPIDEVLDVIRWAILTSLVVITLSVQATINLFQYGARCVQNKRKLE